MNDFLAFDCYKKMSRSFELQMNFSIRRGIASLFGPSGSGKTTALSMIAGFLTPDRGRISVDEIPYFESKTSLNLPIQRRRIGFVQQGSWLFPHLSVRANLCYGMTRPGSAGNKLFESIVDLFQLQNLLSRYPRFLSGGESQRVAIGRAILSRPKLLLLDEPFAGIDEKLTDEIIGYLLELITDLEMPTLFVSHNRQQVQRFSEWTVVINEGSRISQGPTDEVLFDSRILNWNQESALVNLIEPERFERTENQWIAYVGGQPIKLPASFMNVQVRCIEFSPSDVVLSLDEAKSLSARNRIRGKVVEIRELDESVFVQVNAGQPIWAKVTQDAISEMSIRTGADLFCIFKTQCLKIRQ